MPKKTTRRNQKVKNMRSLKVYKNPKPFLSFIVTEQTYYWLIIMLLLLTVYIWAILTQVDINDTLNSTLV